jgi:hypothetical protein
VTSLKGQALVTAVTTLNAALFWRASQQGDGYIIFIAGVWSSLAVLQGLLLGKRVRHALFILTRNPLDITDLTRDIAIAAFRTSLPEGWKAYVVSGTNYDPSPYEVPVHGGLLKSTLLGICLHVEKTILIFSDTHRPRVSFVYGPTPGSDELETLVHEIVHALDPELTHGETFDHAVKHGTHMVWDQAMGRTR